MRDAGEWYGEYAERVAAVTSAYNEALVARAGDRSCRSWWRHFMVGGVKVDAGAPRGERELHMGEAYTATAQAIPRGAAVRRDGSHPRAAAGAGRAGACGVRGVAALRSTSARRASASASWSSTSSPDGSRRSSRSRSRAGVRSQRVTGTWDEIEARGDELRGRFLDLTVQVGGADTDLARRAAETFPYLVNVRALRPERPPARSDRDGAARPTDEELYAEFARRATGEEPPPELLALFREVLEEPPMRPRELTLKGFRSYREETTFDLARPPPGRRRRARSAPGSRSILDAIAFALYGKTPTFERDTKSLINQTASDVPRRAALRGRRPGVARRRGGSGARERRATKLERLVESDEPDAEVLEPITGEKRAVRERVEQLLGMDFDGVLSLGAARAEPVRRVPEGDAEGAQRGIEGRLRVRALRRGARGREATRDGGAG